MEKCCTGNEKGNDKSQNCWGDHFDIEYENTETGVRVEIRPKDPKKAKGFQETVKFLGGLCESCGCRCCCC